MKKIKAGTICFISTIGHNNFWYPIFDETGKSLIVEDIQNVKTKSWISGVKKLRAVEVRVSNVKDLYGDPRSPTIVWVHENDIEGG